MWVQTKGGIYLTQPQAPRAELVTLPFLRESVEINTLREWSNADTRTEPDLLLPQTARVFPRAPRWAMQTRLVAQTPTVATWTAMAMKRKHVLLHTEVDWIQLFFLF